MAKAHVTAEPSFSDRIDSLPVNKEHRRVLVGSGLGWALDAMDVGLISFILVALVKDFQIPQGSMLPTWIVAAGSIGMMVGAAVGGLLADRFGRRNVFAITLLIFGVATGLSALIPGFSESTVWGIAPGLLILLVLRFFVGVGLGAELPVASTYVSEFSPARVRGRMVVILEGFWAVGWLLAAFIGYFVVGQYDDGQHSAWRWAFAIGALPAIYAFVVRWKLPESPRWLAQQGRAKEADAVLDQLEASAPIFGSKPVPVVTEKATHRADAPVAKTGGQRLKALWAPEFRLRTLSLWVVWFFVNFAYYGAFIWMPTFLVNEGYPMAKAFGFTLIITLAQIPGYAVAGWLIEKWGRRATLSVFLVGSAISAIFFGTASSWGEAAAPAVIIASGCALSFFNLGAWGALYAVTPEVYPTSLRATGAGWAAGVGRVAAIIAPFIVPVLALKNGVPLVFTLFSVAFAIAAAAAWGLTDRKGRGLDDR